MQHLFENHPDSLVATRYQKIEPIVSLVNMENLESRDSMFTLSKPTDCQIYCTGEMDIDMAAYPKKYCFQPDDIELYIQTPKGYRYDFIFPWNDATKKLDTISYSTQGAEYFGRYDKSQKCYNASILIPWSTLHTDSVNHPASFKFNIAIADNDDNIRQKAKKVWADYQDPRDKTPLLGMLQLVDTVISINTKNTVFSPRTIGVTLVNNSIDTTQNGNAQIENIVFGDHIKKEDLSGNYKVKWNDKGLLFSVNVNDDRMGRINLKEVPKQPHFQDFGWIEDAKGKKVWTMTAYFSKHAGGALKNQLADTVIKLKAGKYKLHYQTDESHSWNSWDAPPPHTAFYGIVVYQFIKP